MINIGYSEASLKMNKKSNKKNIFSFLGIDYASSAENEQRWSTTRVKLFDNAPVNKHRVISPQITQDFELLSGMSMNTPDVIQQEDCLNLNVFTPNKQGKLPVMVWIHGGGFQIGSGSLPLYDGCKLAQATDTVVVTINYRLGALGFLRLCDITKGAITSTGNEGLGDQITALKWIQQNIHHFGGDKNNITLFGESAGAMSIGCLLASPKAKNLFHKAILQSGAAHTYSSIEKANKVAKAFIESANALGYSVEDLNVMSTNTLMDIQKHFLGRPEVYQQFGMLPFTPVIEDALLPIAPHEAIKQGCAKETPLLVGTNTDEWTLFAAMLRQNIQSDDALNAATKTLITNNQLTAYLPLIDAELIHRQLDVSPQNRLNELLTDYWFGEPCHRLLTNHSISGGTGYRYKLGRRSVIEKLKCTHVADIGFVFGHPEAHFHGKSPRVNELVEQIQKAWGTFAHTGKPAAPEYDWPAYGESNQYTYFNHDNTYIDEHLKDNISFWSGITDAQLAAF